MVNLFIDGIAVQAENGMSVLEAAKKAGINIPTLCYLKGVNAIGACRMCIVEIEGSRAFQAACVMPVAEGMKVKTHTQAVMEARRSVLELIVTDHNRQCLSCVRNRKCELQTLCDELGVDDSVHEYEGAKHPGELDNFSLSIVRDPSKCVLCRRCVAACNHVQEVHAIGMMERGFQTMIGAAFNKPLGSSTCINCGQCVAVCPVGALTEKDSTQLVFDAINDPDKHVVFQTAPAVRVALGEEFGMPVGTRVTGKMVTAIKMLGADKVFDTDFGADLTIMEEGTELINRLKNGGKLPMITTCCPAWYKFCEQEYHDFLDNLSTCKSPHEMLGALLKTYYAKQHNINPADVFVVSVMPCTAKKYEAGRPELSNNGLADVDAVLTTRELAKMIRNTAIDFKALSDSNFDDVLGDSTGAAVIFGATGGVMEAALRTVADVMAGESLDKIDFKEVRGIEGVREADVKIGGKTLHVALAHGGSSIRKLLQRVRDGEAHYDFIEIMTCSGGCVTGGGQPHISSKDSVEMDVRVKRAEALYDEDEDMELRKSHLNPSVKKVYDEFLGEPNSHLAHDLLHTGYTRRALIG